MRSRICQKYCNCGSAIAEYALILGLVGLALAAMNIYIKRGMQGQVKDMTDLFLGAQGPEDTSSSGSGGYVAESNTTSGRERYLSQGGKTKVHEKTSTTMTGRSVDEDYLVRQGQIKNISGPVQPIPVSKPVPVKTPSIKTPTNASIVNTQSQVSGQDTENTTSSQGH
jgi:hypothetical protein